MKKIIVATLFFLVAGATFAYITYMSDVEKVKKGKISGAFRALQGWAAQRTYPGEDIPANGREVERLSEGNQPAGVHQFKWNATNVSSGIYFYRLRSGGFTETKKMVLVK